MYYLSIGVVVVRLLPSTEMVNARKGEGCGSPTVVISYCRLSNPSKESSSDAVIGEI